MQCVVDGVVVAMGGAPPRASSGELQRGRRSPWPSLLAPLGLSLALSFSSPSMAIPFPSSAGSPAITPTTPFSQSRDLKLGLEDGKIRPCPSVNPSCVSTNPKSSSFAFPLIIPSDSSSDDALKALKIAIVGTQKNVKFQDVEETPSGQYLQAEVDGGFGRDVMEFLVKGDVVAYRCMATKVTYVYPFTTAFGDSKGQEERVDKIVEQLGWYSPKFETMD
ncbi:thylakoid lumenal 17.9 kDa protein, chloroplast [Wolffia australiana]